VKFDDGPIEDFKLLEERDNSRPSEVAVIRLSLKSQFIDKLLKTKNVKVEALFFRKGARVFTFDVHGLDLSQITAETER